MQRRFIFVKSPIIAQCHAKNFILPSMYINGEVGCTNVWQNSHHSYSAPSSRLIEAILRDVRASHSVLTLVH